MKPASRMHALPAFVLFAAALFDLRADSYHFTLEQKVKACTAIVRAAVTEITPPPAKSPVDPVVCKAKVLEVLKGPSDLKEVEFRFNAYNSFSSDKLPRVRKEYIVFLHEPPFYDQPPNKSWVFEGPAGIRPIAEQYHEYRISPKNEITTETLSHSNFVAAIRTFASQQESKKK